jgi:hypothetical protein
VTNADTPKSDDEKYADYGAALVLAVDASIRPWLQHVVGLRIGSDDFSPALNRAIEDAALEVHTALTALAMADVDQPLSGPLERIRQAIARLTPHLLDAGAVPSARDPFDVQMRPDDLFALGPMAFVDLGDAVHTAGITWGAAKAHLHQKRRQGSSE